MTNQYVNDNDMYVTSSKLKCFLNNPVEYKLKYIDKIEIPGKEKRCFVIGSAFDDLVSYGESYFLEKYYIDKGLVKEQLYKQAVLKGEISPQILKTRLLPQLRSYIYEGRKNPKIRLTNSEGDCVMGMYREIKRQPLMDFGSKYETQKEVVCEYKGLRLKGRLDRFSSEKCIIRDWKTTGKFDLFEYDMTENYDYILSMAFYFTLIRVTEKIDCDVYLDVVNKQTPYQSVVYKVDKQIMLEKVKSKIIPGLEKLIECQKKDERLPVYPLTGQPIPRMELFKSEYYLVMEAGIQKSTLEPMI